MLQAHKGILTLIGTLVFAGILPTQAGTLTLTWTGATWNDGGAFSGTFTAAFDDQTDLMMSLLSADIVTGNGPSDGFPGQQYLYGVEGYSNTVYFLGFDAQQAGGSAANELVLSTNPSSAFLGHSLYLDWQGTSPTGLYVGSAFGQYTSENTPFYGTIRSLNSQGGSEGVATPEPATFGLAGLGLFYAVRRRRRVTVASRA